MSDADADLSNEDSSEEEARVKELLELYATISARSADGEGCPLVLKSDLNPDEQDEHVLMQEDYAEVQSFLDREWSTASPSYNIGRLFVF